MAITLGEIAAMQDAIQTTDYNITVDVIQHNSADDSDTVVAASVLCSLAPAEMVKRGDDREGVDTEPLDALMDCLPNEALIRGRIVQIRTVNGLTATGAQAKRYRVLRVDDKEFLGLEYEVGLAEQA